MIWEILRFGREALEVLASERASEFVDVFLGEYFKVCKYLVFF